MLIVNTRLVLSIIHVQIVSKRGKSVAQIGTDTPPPSLSPITIQCDKDKALKIHSIVPSLLELAVYEATTFDQYNKFTKIHLTHLHPDRHNISP